MKRKRIPTDKLTLAWCRAQEWVVDLAERKRGLISLDFLGFADVVGIAPDPDTGVGVPIAIQHTGGKGGNFANRRAKVLNHPNAGLWALAGGRVLVLCWRTEDTPPRVEDVTGVLRGDLTKPQTRKPGYLT